MSFPDLTANTVVGRLSTSTGPAEAIPIGRLAIAMALAATSVTSLTIGTGTQTLTTQANLPISVGQILLVAYVTVPADYMVGQVTSYNVGTGVLVLNVTATSGSGTFASWTITQTGPTGATGATGSAGGIPIGAAGGTVDAITSTITGVVLADQQQCAVVSAGANTSTTPTFAPNALTAHTITARGGAALGAGDIGAAGFVAIFEYNLANTRWELLNPSASVRLSTFTTAGDLVQGAGAGAIARLALGTARQVPTVNAGATALAYQNPITLATEQASTSGTSIDFTGIPVGVRRITVMFNGVSTSGTDFPSIQLGISSGPVAAGYKGGSASQAGGSSTFTTAFSINSGASAAVLNGALVLTLMNAATFEWTAIGNFARSDGVSATFSVAGAITLSAVLDRIRVTTLPNQTDTFDAGSINIAYE